jgi:hypothetical protein
MAALTVKVVTQSGKLQILEDTADSEEVVGTGRIHASSRKGYVTMTLAIDSRERKVGKYIKHSGEQFLVIRVPIDWVQALAQTQTEEDDG